MPIYDYLCSSCGERTEVIHGITDPGPRFCPACGAEGTLRKAFAPPAVHFKGSGWAKKDRSTSGTKARSSGDARPDSGAAKGGSPAGDAPSAKDSTAGASAGDGGGERRTGGASASSTDAAS